MRVLHTSDWHLGRTLHGVDMHEHQQAFLDHLVDFVRTGDIDAVLVSGDVYDRAVPSVQSVKLLSAGLARLSALTQVIITPGNHDSAIRLGFAAELMQGSLRILADVRAINEPVVLNDGEILIYGIPYLDPDAARGALTPDGEEPPARSHEGVLAAAMDRIRADIASRPSSPTTIVMAHAFVAGGAVSDSERDISIGGVNSVAAGVFDGVDYVALGHLHGAQKVATGEGRPIVRYSGSPLAYSFSEMGHHKSSVLLDIGSGRMDITLIPTPVPRRLGEVRGMIDDLLGPRHDSLVDAWLRVYVTDPVYPEQMFARLKERFPHALIIQHEPEGVAARATAPQVSDTMDPMTVAAEFVEFATNAAPTDPETAVLRRAYDAVLNAGRSD